MDIITLIFFLIMYIWGFTLTIWAIFYDKHPTKLSVNVSKFALFVLICTVFYFIYMFGTGQETLVWSK